MTIQELVRELDQTFEHFRTRRTYYGKIGKLTDTGAKTINEGLEDDPSLVWVTLNGLDSSPKPAICTKVARKFNSNVILQYNPYGRLEVVATDSVANIRDFAELASSLNVPQIAGETVEARWTENNLAPRAFPAQAGGLYVTVEPFDWDGGYFAGGDLLLTVPSTASKKAWIVVCLDTADNTLKQITGTEVSLAYTLTHTELAAVTITSGYIPLWGFVLANGQTTITGATQNEPLRYRLNSVGGGTSDANAIHDNVSGEINAITEKAITANGDVVIIEDSAASYAKKKVKAENFRGRINSLTLIGW